MAQAITGPEFNRKFMVKSVDEIFEVGRISKQWSGVVNEMCTDADNFGVQFPINLDVKIKAVMLGACFLIRFRLAAKNPYIDKLDKTKHENALNYKAHSMWTAKTKPGLIFVEKHSKQERPTFGWFRTQV
ncbi:unnamed protein product [Ranitomeya imitator]|uniref:Phospholipid scramblase n=1 Tax=Ranitomeya imitator TaxID=111125 RepID=A0ABN9LQM3_9NEOB|nr:unnamed protein product [Ranitomeya imitator]